MSSRSVIEWFRWDDAPLAHNWTLFLPIHPVIVDTNILISDMIEVMTRQQPSRLLSLARLGKARFFASAHVDQEMRERLPERMWPYRVQPLAALEEWMTVYRPLIRFVKVPELDLGDPRPMRVRELDLDDVPTARLVALLAPVISLSRDPHLLDAGVARSDWGNVIQHGSVLAAQDLLLIGGSVAVTTGVHLGARAARAGYAAIRLSRVPPIAVLIGAGVIVLAVLLLGARPQNSASKTPQPETPEASTWQQSALAWAADVGLGALHAVDRALTATGAAADMFDRGKIAAAVPAGIEQIATVRAVSQLLAVAPRPMTATEIVQMLRHSSQVRRVDVSAMLALLRSQPAFVRIGPSQWQLGAQKAVDRLAIGQMRRARPLPMFDVWHEGGTR